ncbi:hypothetical protein K2Q08_03170, partial [Patescibacteria group bacterium]|nr:hypothetical protein [Patescibacteria group bacterium]
QAATVICAMEDKYPGDIEAALLAFPSISNNVRTRMSAHTASRVLPHAQFLSDSIGSTEIYVEKNRAFVQSPNSNGIMVSSAVTANHAAYVMRGGDGNYHVFDDGREIFASKSALVGIDRSADGKFLVYAEQATTSAPVSITGISLRFLSLNPNEWTVLLRDVDTGKTIRVGTGVHPFFLGDRYVVRVAPVGIFITDLATGSEHNAIQKIFSRVSIHSLVSPDRTHMGVSDSSTKTTIYSVSPQEIKEIAVLPTVQQFATYALGNTALYTIRMTNAGTEILRKSLSGSQTESAVLLLPSSLRITRLVLSH